MSLQYPVKGKVYSLREIYTELKLRDDPFLRFFNNDFAAVIQDGPLTEEELLAIPAIADTQWMYEFTTHEDIPLFFYHGARATLDELVVIEVNQRDSDGSDPYWVCWKASYRAQQ